MNLKKILISVFISLIIIGIILAFPLGQLGIILVPINMFVVYKKENIYHSIVSMILTGIILIFINFFVAIFIMSFAIGVFLVLYFSEKKQLKAFETQIALTFVIALSIVFIKYLIVSNFGTEIDELFAMNFDEIKEIMNSYGILEAENVTLEEIQNQMKLMLPFTIIFVSFIDAVILFFANRFVLLKMGFSVSKLGSLSNFKLPNHFIYGSGFILLLSYLSGKIGIIDFELMYVNIILIIIFVFSIQGLALISYFSDKYNLPKVIKYLIVGISIFFPGIVFLAFFGWLDSIFRFRLKKE